MLCARPVSHEDAEQAAAAFKELFSPAALSQVKFVSSNCPSGKFVGEVKQACDNLVCVSLDPAHLAIVYEYAQWGKRSPGSKVVRQLLRKFTQIDASKNMTSRGPFFTDIGPRQLRPIEWSGYSETSGSGAQ